MRAGSLDRQSHNNVNCRQIIRSRCSGLVLNSLVILLTLLTAAGCANVTYFTYQPVSEAERRTRASTAEGSWIEYTSHFWESELDSDVTMKIDIAANTRPSVTVKVSVYVRGDATFALTSATIRTAADRAAAGTPVSLDSFKLSVYGKEGTPGYFITKAPTEQLQYTGLNDWLWQTGTDRYDAEANLAIEPPRQITLVLPGVIINGNKKTLPPIVFVRQELEGRFKLN